MNAWKVILATLVIFSAGVITGGLLVKFAEGTTTHAAQPGTPENPRRPTATAANRQYKLPPPLPGPLRKDFLDRLDRDLKLSSQQREGIEKIISEGQDKAKAIWDDVEPDMHDVLTETRTKICGELTAEQRARFEQSVRQKARTNAHPASVEGSTNAVPVSPKP